MDRKREVEEKLKKIKYPGYSRDIVSFGFVKDIKIKNNKVEITLKISTPDESKRRKIIDNIKKELKNLAWIEELKLIEEKTESGQFVKKKPRGVNKVVAVSSAKGGVGKSFVSANLAFALKSLGMKTGLLDADVFGPSIPLMLGVTEKPTSPDGVNIVPVLKSEIEIMSIGLFLNPDDPVIWRGPMVMKLMDQFFNNVLWDRRDIVVLDLPPGTGDVQLSMAQSLEVDGVIIVTTPQKVAIQDVRRGINMFKKLDIKIIGIVENMSYLTCPHCGKTIELFPDSKTETVEREYGVKIISRIPLEPSLSKSADEGMPPIETYPDSPVSKEITKVAEIIKNELFSENKT